MSDVITDDSRNDKEAIQKFRESIRKEIIKSFTPKELTDELSKRPGIKEIIVAPYEAFTISKETTYLYKDTGYARILVVNK